MQYETLGSETRSETSSIIPVLGVLLPMGKFKGVRQ